MPEKKSFPVLLGEKKNDISDVLKVERDKEREEFPPVNSLFENYSLQEIALKAKNDIDAQEEYIARVMKMLEKTAFKLCYNRKYIDASNALSQLLQAAVKAVDKYKYSEDRPFINLFRRMISITCKSIIKTEAIRYSRQGKYLGNRIGFEDAYMCDSASEEDVRDKVIERLDQDEFFKSLTLRQKQLLYLYQNDYSFREIATIVNEPPSTVSYQIYSLLNRYKNFVSKKNDHCK